MMQKDTTRAVTVLDKEFVPYITAEKIAARVSELAQDITRDLCTRNPVFLAVLNGSFFFVADLLKEIDFQYEISFVKIASYIGLNSGGQSQTLIGLDENLRGRNIVIVEDIVDTGRTMTELLAQLQKLEPASIKVATLILKPDALKHEVPLDYIGFECPDLFLVGYGLDYNKQGRHYKDIYRIKNG